MRLGSISTMEPRRQNATESPPPRAALVTRRTRNARQKVIGRIPLDAVSPRPYQASGAEDRHLILAQELANLVDGDAELRRDAATYLRQCGRVVMGVKGCDDPVE